jgi:DNA (cytosine-5)-methyltransferase 1
MRTFVDLFAGAGLFSAGFASAGFRPILAVDADPLAVESYRRNVAAVATCAPVEKVAAGVRCDVLAAGPPCQGFSSLGTRDPSDRRNRLCLAIVKWAAETKARVVVVENVPPFLQSSQWRRMSAALRRGGYELVTWTLDAADFGTPQHRLRSFTVASKIGVPEEPRPVAHVAAAVAFAKIRPGDPMHVWPQPSAIAAARFARVPEAGDRRDILAAAPRLCPPSWFDLGCQATDGWGRIDRTHPANTLKSRFQNPSTGRYLHPSEDRVISLREGARLQGVPDHWIFVGHREAMVRQIGNGVPVPLGRAVAIQVGRLFERARRPARSVA